MHGTFATQFPRFLAVFVPFGTFATDMVLLRRGGTIVAKLEKGLTKTSLDPTWATEVGRHETVGK